ncbi:MAG TPA: hypothetical protein ACHBY4_05155 [Arsenophonus apicola]
MFSSLLSDVNSNEVNEEQLWFYNNVRKRKLSRREKVNLIVYSQDALFARYFAANYSASIVSVTSMNGVNHDSEIADLIIKVLIPDKLTEPGVVSTAKNIFTFIFFISLGTLKPQDQIAGAFSKQYDISTIYVNHSQM